MSRFAILARLMVLPLIALTSPSHGICAPGSDADQPVKAGGVIDRVVVAGSEPVFRADGYTFRILPGTEMRFGRGLQALSEVGTNTWAMFEGKPDGSGEIVATKAAFAKLKFPKNKSDANAEQVTEFPPNSKIDADTGFAVSARAFQPEDHGGWCGWYGVPSNPVEQEHIRRLGMKVVPQYQRDLPADDPAKIPFRFYAVEEQEIRSAIFCGNGLVLVPVEVINRLQSEDQLAAVLADGVAGVLQQQAANARTFTFTLREVAEVAAYGALGFAGPIPAAGAGVLHMVDNNIAQRERGRMALAFIADAGFDPRQAPEAWRLLAPGHLPKDRTKLKYPERSRYLQNFLEVQYKRVPDGSAPRKDDAALTSSVP